MAVKNKQLIAQWFVTTCTNGNEDTVIKNLKAKVQAMHFDEYIIDAKTIKRREIIEEIFDDNNPQKLPPKSMRNSSNIKWKTLGNGKYLKVKIIDRNKFPGYIYVKMIMNDDTWFAVRNAQNISGLVGSFGKGAKPIPITFDEEMLLSGESLDEDYYAVVTSNSIIEVPKDKFDSDGNLIGFDSTQVSNLNKKIETVTDVSDLLSNDENKSITNNFDNEYTNISKNSKLIPENKIYKSNLDPKDINSNFKIGHTVTILFGDHAGIDGQVIGLNLVNNEIEVQIIDFMGKTINLVLPLNQVKLKE
ncbi:transcription termination/antitermination protein NusG [Mycoplasmoides alvi]|uniref:transcription termination/antitermination protein NusG n=1 Tax=Mycoplasmoides alvi TaxID=78580 RepID=UPI00051B7BED|nr:transcription termination/antitermination protein NusG [Mycoplasmoides alvi]